MSPDSLQFGLGLLKDQPEDQFTRIDYSKVMPAIRAQTNNYLEMYLTPEAQPQKDSKFRTRIFAATEQTQNDLIEYRWIFDGLPLRAVQSLNALKLEIPLAQRARTRDLKAVVESIVKLRGTDIEGEQYDVRLRWPNEPSEGVQFSSNPGVNIHRLRTWHDRVDAFVEGGRLSILIYKKIPQLITYQDGSQWFKRYTPSTVP